jgi:DNA primase
MINYDLLSVIEKILGKGRITSGNNYSFFSPFINHYKPKLEIDLTANNNGQNFWHCWVSNAKGRDIISLFKKIKVEKSYMDTLYKIVNRKNLYLNSNDNKKEESITLPNEFVKLYEYPIIKDIQVKMQMKQALNYLKSRGIIRTDILRYNIGYCANGVYSGRIIVPSYDANFNLNFFVSRSIFEEDTLKYKNPKVSKNIIGFECFINWNEPVTLVEGVFDAITARYNAIPLFGKIIQPRLMEKIVLCKPPKVIVALDNDAISDSIKISSMLIREGIDVSFVKMELKDINEMGFKDFSSLKLVTPTTDSYDIIKQRIMYA